MIKLYCPVCYSWWEASSLEDLIREATEGWKHLKPTKEQWETINSFNDPKRLQEILDQKGYIIAICKTCMTNLFIDLLRKHGYGVVGGSNG